MAGLAYLDVARLTGDIFMGGLMTVNETGIPVEFIYTEPINPSRLQVSLYGTTLERYLSLDVIGKGLIEGSRMTGIPTIVSHGELLQLATRVKQPLCQLSATNLQPLDDVASIKEGQGDEVLAQLAEIQNPWSIRYYDRVNFPVEKHINNLVDCAARFDLLEPLTRIRRTLELLKGRED